MHARLSVAIAKQAESKGFRDRTLNVPVEKKALDRLVLKAYPVSQVMSNEERATNGAAPLLGETAAMARVLCTEEQLGVLHRLCEGNSINSTSRQTGVSKNAILRLLVRVGRGCRRLHSRLFRGLSCPLIQCDEIWSYIGKKGFRVTENDPAEWGEAYTFVALDVASRAVIAYEVGRRGEETTSVFIASLRDSLVMVPQITTDGFTPYIAAIAQQFGGFVDYAQTVKRYTRGGARRRDDHRYEPPRDPFIEKRTIFGAPDMDAASTALVERQNRTIRMCMRRLTRLCDAYSKKRENHDAATALHFAYYNLVRIHETIKTAPAVALKVIEKPWTIAELLEAALAEEESEPARRSPLAARPEVGPARELPNGRGFLRLVTVPAAPSVPTGRVKPTEASEPAKLVEAPPPREVTRQMDLFEWLASARALRPQKTAVKPPPPPPGTQLSLFDDGKD